VVVSVTVGSDVRPGRPVVLGPVRVRLTVTAAAAAADAGGGAAAAIGVISIRSTRRGGASELHQGQTGARRPGAARRVDLLVHTGRHYDAGMSDVFFADLCIRAPDVSLEVGSGSYAVQTGRAMATFEPVVDRYRPDVVVGRDPQRIVAAATDVLDHRPVRRRPALWTVMRGSGSPRFCWPVDRLMRGSGRRRCPSVAA